MSRSIVVLAALSTWLVAPAAHAQQPFQMPSMAPKGETAFVVEDVDSQRFYAIDEATAGPSLSSGEAVTVITREAGRVRFMVRGKFGWVPEAALAAEPPPAPEEELPGANDPLLPPG